MKIELLSSKYSVRTLTENDIETIYQLEVNNPMFFQYCPPFVTYESIKEDMKALPPKKTYEDKYYIGFFEEETLVAIMDLILKYPNDKTAFIGLFMMNHDYQGKGLGTRMIDECANCLKTIGFEYIRLGYAKGNPQSKAFWLKNQFIYTGLESKEENYTAVILQRELVRHEKSCGAVVYTKTNDERFYLIVKMLKGHFGFPKGHVEDRETELETALREIKEETGLDVEMATNFKEEIEYRPFLDCVKKVVYFIAFSNEIDTHRQVEEISEIQWLTYEEALNTLNYENDKNILRKVEKYLDGTNQ